MIPTAEEFLLQQDCLRNVEDYFDDVQPIDLIEFAKLHVQAALEAASDNACIITEGRGFAAVDVVDKASIQESYPLDLIK